MPLPRLLIAACALLLTAQLAQGQAPNPNLTTAQGVVDKVSKDTLVIKPRGADGKFEKAVTLKVTGTSNVSSLTIQMRAGKPVPVQQSVEVKDIEAKQAIAVIYTEGAAGPVLLTAVVMPAK